MTVDYPDLYTIADWSTFRGVGLSGFSSGSLTQVPPPGTGGTCTDPGVNGDDPGSDRRRWASPAAPDAAVVLASCHQHEHQLRRLYRAAKPA